MLSRTLGKLPGGLLAGVVLAAWVILGGTAKAGDEWHGPGMAFYTDFNPKIPMAVYIVKVDRKHPDLRLYTTLGGGRYIGMATLSQQAGFIPPSVGQPLAGINGDYFGVREPYVGDPLNLHIMLGGELISAPGEDRAFFFIDAKGNPQITNAISDFKVTWPNGKVTPFGLNQTPMTGQAVLYTAAAGPDTRIEGVDLILERNGQDPWLPLRINQTLNARVKAINKNGYSKLNTNIMVLSLSPRQLRDLPELKEGMVLKISTDTIPNLKGAQVAIGGGPSLVKNGKPRDFDGIQVRHPRSAFGFNDRYYFFVQVDGRQARHSLGMTYRELAEYFVKLGCTDALNLDGGGSASMWVNGRIVNSPSQGRERPAANALFLIRVPKP
ncbi:MAG: phosphodiester glycosidase family protein [Verrucomicrobiae bacterium]|nr:phosphodiester glycosidase family protein [Verrucomicrobiae bacterium]